MADIKEFVVPSFLSGQNEEEIMVRMLAKLPNTLDKSQGSLFWDMLYPTAFEKAQAVEFTLTEAIKNMFPMWAEGDMLDYHGNVRSITRKAAVAATGTVTITGINGSVIEAGTVLMTTPSGFGSESIVFVTTERAAISSGTASVGIVAQIPGASGNVAAGAVNRFDDAPDGVDSVTNPAATSGGVDVESDDDLRDRIVEYDQSIGTSFVGSISDYKRWALEVDGVGVATVVPASDGSGVVKIVILDANREPVSIDLCTAVYNYITRPDDELMRKAPPGAELNVISPTLETVTVSAALVIASDTDTEAVKADFIDLISGYYASITDGIVRYSKVGQLIMSVSGVIDYSDLLVDGGIVNVTVGSDMIPSTPEESVVFTA